MALVKKLKPLTKERGAPHGEVECTFSVFTDECGNKYLQFDTYGSRRRKIPGKVSQSLQFSAESIRQLKHVLDREFP